MDYKQRLKEYVEEDLIYQDWRNDKIDKLSDFDEFSIKHILDIKDLLDEVELLEKKLKREVEYCCDLQDIIFDKKGKNKLDKIRELLIEYQSTEEYCGKVGLTTTKFVEDLGDVLSE